MLHAGLDLSRRKVDVCLAVGAALDDYLVDYNYDRAHTGRLTQGRVPAGIARRTQNQPGRSAPVATTPG